MDWIKVYDKHLFRWPLKEIGAIVKLQLLTAKLERIPTQKEMAQEVPATTLSLVQARLKPPARPLQEVLELVLEDVQAVVDRRSQGRQRNEKWRKHHQKKIARRVSKTKTNEADKIREDKIREDKSIKGVAAGAATPQGEFVDSWKAAYLAKTGQAYKAGPKDFVLAASLLKDFTPALVIQKAKWLFTACENRVWPGKNGFADFTISRLSSKWNEILEGGQSGKQAGVSKSELDEFIASHQ